MGLEFAENTLSTVGIEKRIYKMVMEDGTPMKIKLWDTAGQERFRVPTLDILNNSQGIALVYDISDRNSFDNIEYWLEAIRERTVDVPIALFGNKCDIEERKVSEEEGKELAQEQGMLFFETSAKNNQGVTEGFSALANQGYNKFKYKNNIVLESPHENNGNSRCCAKKGK